MPVVLDKGNLRNRINSKLGDLVANLLGQRMNYLLRYYSHRHRFPNFKHPKDLSERILSAMLKKEFLQNADYADKVKVREYIVQKGLGNILLKQFGNWESAEEIDFSGLPDKFILKANNGSGGHVICTDKSLLNIPETVTRINKTLHEVRHLRNTEPHYCCIKPQILCEELLGDGITLPVDYKFHCIRGHIADIFVVCEREDGAKYCTLDTKWEVLPYTLPQYMPKTKPKKPENLDEMIRIAEKLSEDFEFVRVDLYDFEGKIYFGELTFSPWGGIMNSYTTEALEILGSKFEKSND